ncbi:PDZ domain-containing protein [Aestuariibacter halophilus]|uniref:PDZ domain-containing protein n=1 Tax=Fluctibacter halophilus TaxID=226011 RepID=A0ABS8G7B5_9ALTE|nr:PDZ domain-containing protein [Aestuariibacter halophilus]MCC2616435.1 PDZ domain-containing protein [Aestuariibacter halophilus]
MADNRGVHPCRHCLQPIPIEATRCFHCQASVSDTSRWRQWATQAVALIGAMTAALSLFYALREGYYAVEKRQQHREALQSYLDVADFFDQQQATGFALDAYNKALALSSSDLSLQRKVFVLQAGQWLAQQSGYADHDQQSELRQLIMDGFRLLNQQPERSVSATLNVRLAQLLPYDRDWYDPALIQTLYTDALHRAGEDIGVLYPYAQWLIRDDVDPTYGLTLLEKAAQLAPDAAHIRYAAGHQTITQTQQMAAGLSHFLAAVDVDSPSSPQVVEGKVNARQALRRWMLDMTEPQWLALSGDMQQRLLDAVASLFPRDRRLALVSARRWQALARPQRALDRLAIALPEEQRSEGISAYTVDAFEVLHQLLAQSSADSAEAQALETRLQDYHAAQQEQQVMEWGIEGQHRYKVGLVVWRHPESPEQQGIPIKKAYGQYPFARAGVKDGDWLVRFAHRDVSDIRVLLRLLGQFSPGSDVPMTVKRDDQSVELMLTVE